jgi:hypothetical protein
MLEIYKVNLLYWKVNISTFLVIITVLEHEHTLIVVIMTIAKNVNYLSNKDFTQQQQPLRYSGVQSPLEEMCWVSSSRKR